MPDSTVTNGASFTTWWVTILIPGRALEFVQPNPTDRRLRMFELLAMGTNDYAQPAIAQRSVEAAIANARQHGRIPVVISPNAANSVFAATARGVCAAADAHGALVYVPRSWAPDQAHPSNLDYDALAQTFEGQVIRGDSFATAILQRQSRPNPLSWQKSGASAAVVLEAIFRIDRAGRSTLPIL